MNKLSLALVAICSAMVVCAETPAAAPAAATQGNAPAAAKAATPAKKSLKQMTPEERRAHILARTGGKIPQPKTMRGRIVFLDTQKLIPDSEITAMLPSLSKDGRYNWIIEKGEYKGEGIKFFSSAKAQYKADIIVVVISDPDSPIFLAAPEDGWAMVNTFKIDTGLKGDAKDKFLASRYRKELMRAFVYAVGTPHTQFPGNIISAACARDLDLCQEFVPVDALQKTMFRLKDMGVMPERLVPYRRACMEGWAPAPTNAIQKAVWDEVRALPDKPLKIKYDAKRDAGK